MIKLSKRLKALLSVLPENGNIIADIGCDHGKLLISAILSNKFKQGIGIDLSEKSLKKAELLANQYNLDKRITFHVGNGFGPIKAQLDCAVIAGLGGIETTEILKQNIDCKIFVLSPHQDTYFLRNFMMQNNFVAEKDFVVFDKNKYYSIIVAKKGKCDYNNIELQLGKNIPSTEEFYDRNIKRLDYLNNIFANIPSKENISKELIDEKEMLEKWQQSLK